MYTHVEPRVSRRGFRPQQIATELTAATPCIHADLTREDTGR
ncbi:MAG TPA: hypothetical protein VK983_01535 [Candidatus Limnocylindrales bacterium]|nr:hypothetical protein [Candidatus Limnocylindrales bacterium]